MDGKRILLVDGDSDSRSVYRTLLRYHGLEVMEVDNGEAAPAVVAEARPDVVVMELTLMRRDGHELLKQLLAEWPALCVIVLTARGLESDREQAEQAGCARFLTKPLEPQALLREIRELTGG